MTPEHFLLRLEDLNEVVREDHCRHSDSNPLCALHHYYGDLRRKYDRLLVPSIIGVDILCDLRREEDLLRKGKKTAFDISSGCSTVSGEEVSVVALLLNEEI